MSDEVRKVKFDKGSGLGYRSNRNSYGWFHQFGTEAYVPKDNGAPFPITIAIIEGDDGLIYHCAPGEYEFISDGPPLKKIN